MVEGPILAPTPFTHDLYQEVRGVDFAVCGRTRVTCVVDGDTFWLDGARIRLATIDTPEIHRPKCQKEKALGLQARSRLIELLNAGSFELYWSSDERVDRYGRLLLVAQRDGESIGQQLVREGLAHSWIGRRQSWCVDARR
ncbi:thermonuclease family protein [bacterium BD-1]|nr:thermonuclease family protein [Ottowia caeni]